MLTILKHKNGLVLSNTHVRSIWDFKYTFSEFSTAIHALWRMYVEVGR